MYSLQEIYEQAFNDSNSFHYKSHNGYTKIKSFGLVLLRDNITNDIEVLSMIGMGDYYENLDDNEVKILKEKGWINGSKSISLLRIKQQLINIDDLLSKETRLAEVSRLIKRKNSSIEIYNRINK